MGAESNSTVANKHKLWKWSKTTEPEEWFTDLDFPSAETMVGGRALHETL